MIKTKKLRCFIVALSGLTVFVIDILLRDKLMNYRILILFIDLISWGLTAYGCLGYLYYFVKKPKQKLLREKCGLFQAENLMD